MICQHCGLCCVDYMVVVIKPEYATEDFDINTAPEEAFLSRPGHDPCPNLYWEGDESRCCIHHFKWFAETPCAAFTQVEEGNTECRLGRHIIDNKPGFYRKYCEDVKANYKPLDKIGE